MEIGSAYNCQNSVNYSHYQVRPFKTSEGDISAGHHQLDHFHEQEVHLLLPGYIASELSTVMYIYMYIYIYIYIYIFNYYTIMIYYYYVYIDDFIEYVYM